METFDVAITGAGPAGSVCAAFCASGGLRTLILEREKFPREKVCGDCLNPSCWPMLNRLDLAQRVRALPHAKLASVEFIAIGGRKVIVELPSGDECELSVKRSLFDDLLLKRARELGASTRERVTLTTLIAPAMTYVNHVCHHKQGAAVSEPPGRWTYVSHGGSTGCWTLEASTGDQVGARFVVGADGRNSTVARLCNLLPRPERERIALQSHLPLPDNFGNRVVLQLLPHGYVGLSPVNGEELNVCLVAKPRNINALKAWATKRFGSAAAGPDHAWRTITPLTRAALRPAHENLFLIGDAARVVEPFTGEGIYYAMRSGELAADAILKIIRGEDQQSTLREFARACVEMYRGRLWINRLARAAVLSPRIASFLIQAVQVQPVLRLLTSKIVMPN
jgi:menaquinone-9 beta-reductase